MGLAAAARGLSLVVWQWIYLFATLALLSVADVLFGMKCYHLHEGDCLKSQIFLSENRESAFGLV